MLFTEGLNSKCGFDYNKIDFYWKQSKEFEEDFYYMILDFLYQKDKTKTWVTNFSSLIEELGVEQGDFIIWSIPKRKNTLLPEKLLIIEDEGWIDVWKNFLSEYWIEWVKVVSSDWCTEKKWEKALKLDRKLNSNYNPLVFRVIDRDGFTDDQVQIVQSHFNNSFGDSLNYRFSFLNLNEIENIIIQSPTYETTSFYTSEPNIDSFITTNYDDEFKVKFLKTSHNRLSQNKDIFDFPPAKNDFEQEKIEMENEMKLDKIHRLNGKDIVNLLKKKHSIRFDAMKFLKALKKENFPEELGNTLDEIRVFFS